METNSTDLDPIILGYVLVNPLMCDEARSVLHDIVAIENSLNPNDGSIIVRKITRQEWVEYQNNDDKKFGIL